MSDFKTTKVLNVNFTNAKKDDILEYVVRQIIKKDKTDADKFFIVTPNPEIVVRANSDKKFKNVLNSAKISLADGVGVVIASKILGEAIQARISGVDFMENLCLKLSKQPVTTGFLGGLPGVAEKAADCLREKYPGLRVGYAYHVWEKSRLQDKKLDILFVAFGAPIQEEWIYEHIRKEDIFCAMGVGGSFDFITGRVSRAPEVMRMLGLEWLYRLLIEPWRWKRQLALFTFMKLVLKAKFSPKTTSN